MENRKQCKNDNHFWLDETCDSMGDYKTIPRAQKRLLWLLYSINRRYGIIVRDDININHFLLNHFIGGRCSITKSHAFCSNNVTRLRMGKIAHSLFLFILISKMEFLSLCDLSLTQFSSLLLHLLFLFCFLPFISCRSLCRSLNLIRVPFLFRLFCSLPCGSIPLFSSEIFLRFLIFAAFSDLWNYVQFLEIRIPKPEKKQNSENKRGHRSHQYPTFGYIYYRKIKLFLLYRKWKSWH